MSECKRCPGWMVGLRGFHKTADYEENIFTVWEMIGEETVQQARIFW